MEIENQDATPVEEGSQQPPVDTPLDVEKIDNVGQVRDWGKGWEKSAKEYEPSHKFITEKFGDMSQAELAHEIYANLFSDNFDPNSLLQVIGKVSPSRSQQLIENFAKDKAKELVPQALTELFGENPSKEEIALFKQWREKGIFGESEDLPDFLKFDEEGNPRSEEELQWFRDLKKQADKTNQSTLQAQQEREAQAEKERTREIEASVEEFAESSLKVLEPDLEAFGLAIAPTDTQEVKAEKEVQRAFVLGGIKELFLKNPEALKAYTSAVQHIEKGEPLLAKRYEPQVKKALLTIFRDGKLEKFLSGKTSTPPAKEEGIPNPDSTKLTPVDKATKFDPTARFAELVKLGLIKED